MVFVAFWGVFPFAALSMFLNAFRCSFLLLRCLCLLVLPFCRCFYLKIALLVLVSCCMKNQNEQQKKRSPNGYEAYEAQRFKSLVSIKLFTPNAITIMEYKTRNEEWHKN